MATAFLLARARPVDARSNCDEIPGRLGGLEPSLRRLDDRHTLPEHALGQFGNRRFGERGGTGRERSGQREGGAVEWQHGHALGTAYHAERRIGLADGDERRGNACRPRREFGNDARDAPTGRFEGLHCAPQPEAVACCHPDGGIGAGAGFECEMQGFRIVEQAVFEQAVEHRAQTRGAAQAALRERDLVPGDGGGGHAEDHFVARRQQRGGRAPLGPQLAAVAGPVRPAVFGGDRSGGERNGYKQHGRLKR